MKRRDAVKGLPLLGQPGSDPARRQQQMAQVGRAEAVDVHQSRQPLVKRFFVLPGRSA